MTKSCTTQSSALAQKTQSLRKKAFSLRLDTFRTPSFSSRSFGLANFSPRFMTLGLLSLSLAFLGNCGGCGSSNGNGGSSSAGPTCAENQILKDGSCEACSDPQYPNSDRTACVSNCPDGEYKPTAKPTCEAQVTCTGRQIHNPQNNSCFELNCETNEIADTTASPPACISESDCRTAEGKLVGVDGRSCITESVCTSVPSQLINERGECEACSGDNPVRNADKNTCISADECQTGSAGAYSLLGEANCITDMACQDMPGHVATVEGSCEQCTGEDSIRNMEKTACLSIGDCQSLSENAFSVLEDAECITDAACIAEDGRVATTDGVCQACTGTDNVRSVDKTQCIAASACQVDNSLSLLDGADCVTDAACIAMEGHVVASGGECVECEGDTPVPNAVKTACDADSDSDGVGDGADACPTGETGAATASDTSAGTADPDGDGCKNSEDADDDNDGIADGDDAFQHDACASRDSDSDGLPDALLADCATTLSADACPEGATGVATGADNAPTADPDGDGCKNSEDAFDDEACASADSDGDGVPDALLADCTSDLLADVDDDNDGLIEIHSLEMLDSMRHNLAGTSYKTSATAAPLIAGAPESATADCKTAVDYHVVDATGAASLAGSDPLPAGSTAVSVYLCGYELARSLDFRRDESYADASNKKAWLPNSMADASGDILSEPSEGQNPGWAPVGDNSTDSDSTRFTGIFEGNGHTLRHLYVNLRLDRSGASYAGLFGYTRSNILRNIGLLAPYVALSNADEAAGTVSAGALASLAHGNIIASYAVGAKVRASSKSASSNVSAGGLAGFVVGNIIYSYAIAEVVASSASGDVFAGGLLGVFGYFGNPYITTIASYAAGTVTASSVSGNANAGGLTGRHGNLDFTGIIIDCYSSAAVTARAGSMAQRRIGGLLGFWGSTSIHYPSRLFGGRRLSGQSLQVGTVGGALEPATSTNATLDTRGTATSLKDLQLLDLGPAFRIRNDNDGDDSDGDQHQALYRWQQAGADGTLVNITDGSDDGSTAGDAASEYAVDELFCNGQAASAFGADCTGDGNTDSADAILLEGQ